MITQRKANRPSQAILDHPISAASKSQPLVSALLAWFATNARDLPWRRTRDPYAIWVSEIMLQQTQVKTVIPYWERWMRELPTIESLAKASADKIHKLWEGLGYYTRVRNLQKAAQKISAEHAGQFPQTFDAVLALPGIGRYTAGAICSIAFNQPSPILDGNVIRVLTRIYGIKTDPRKKQTSAQLWQLAGELVGHASGTKSHASACSHLNQSLMELGALVCTPRSPNCAACPVRKQCNARKENLQDQLPNLGKRDAATERRFLAFVVERHGKFLVRQRPAGVVNAHLWEFPNFEVTGKNHLPEQVAQKLSLRLSEKEPLGVIKHSITRYRITLEAWRAQLSRSTPDRGPALSGEWRTLDHLHKVAFTSAHKKILAALAEFPKPPTKPTKVSRHQLTATPRDRTDERSS